MDALLQSQQLQLKLIRSASVNENCAFDLMGIVQQLTLAEAENVLGIIGDVVLSATVKIMYRAMLQLPGTCTSSLMRSIAHYRRCSLA
jgi:hypothetical protein